MPENLISPGLPPMQLAVSRVCDANKCGKCGEELEDAPARRAIARLTEALVTRGHEEELTKSRVETWRARGDRGSPGTHMTYYFAAPDQSIMTPGLTNALEAFERLYGAPTTPKMSIEQVTSVRRREADVRRREDHGDASENDIGLGKLLEKLETEGYPSVDLTGWSAKKRKSGAWCFRAPRLPTTFECLGRGHVGKTGGASPPENRS